MGANDGDGDGDCCDGNTGVGVGAGDGDGDGEYGDKDVGMESGAGDGGGDGDAAVVEAEVVEEKTIFDLKLLGFDAKSKIKVIKEVRAIAGLGLKEAKTLVESAPKIIQKDIKKEKADELKEKLEALGAEIEIV